MPVRKKATKRPRRPIRTMLRKKPALAKMVKQIMNRNEETKIATNQYGFTSFNSGISSSGDLQVVLPSVTQGVGQGNRVGSAITPIKLVIRGYVVYRCDTYQPAVMLGGRLFCFSDKTVSSYTVATSAGSNYNLLDVGGTSSSFTGSAIQFEYPHNNDQFKFYMDKKFKMLKPWGYTNTLGTSATSAITSFNSTMYVPFKLTIPASKMPKMLKYDSTLSTSYPTNFAPFMALGYCNLENYSADVTPTQMAMEWCSTLYFKDA